MGFLPRAELSPHQALRRHPLVVPHHPRARRPLARVEEEAEALAVPIAELGRLLPRLEALEDALDLHVSTCGNEALVLPALVIVRLAISFEAGVVMQLLAVGVPSVVGEVKHALTRIRARLRSRRRPGYVVRAKVLGEPLPLAFGGSRVVGNTTRRLRRRRIALQGGDLELALHHDDVCVVDRAGFHDEEALARTAASAGGFAAVCGVDGVLPAAVLLGHLPHGEGAAKLVGREVEEGRITVGVDVRLRARYSPEEPRRAAVS